MSSQMLSTHKYQQFYNPESLRSPAETTIASFQQNKTEEESNQIKRKQDLKQS